MQIAPHDYWQTVYPPGSFANAERGLVDRYAAALPDGRQILLPIRMLPSGDRAVASLIVNQASFAVVDALCDALAEKVAPLAIDVVVGLPTLGLTIAEGLARRLGHSRYVPLGTSRKFWYRDELSVPLRSITSPDAVKRLYVDPRMLPLLQQRRIVLVDDVISTGASMASALALLARAEISPCAIAVAMLQGTEWRRRLVDVGAPVIGAIETPVLERGTEGNWRPI